jgi:uroporphyrinogen decarboxylase
MAMCQHKEGRKMMKDAGHRSSIEAALRFERTDRTPFNNFSNIVAVRSAGHIIKDARFNSKVSSESTIRYAKMTRSDFIKPCLDTNVEFLDISVPKKIPLKMPDDNYIRITDSVINTPEDVDRLEFYDPFDPKTCPNFTKGFVENISALSKAIDEDWHICGFCWAPLSFAGFLMGAEQMMMDIMLEPDHVTALLKKTTKMSKALQCRCIDAGATMMWMADPTAGEDLIDSTTYAGFELGCVSEVAKGVHEFRKEAPLFLHMCGQTADDIKLLPDIGIQCFSCDFKTDMAAARASAGKRMAIMGNVSPVTTLMMGSPQDVKNEVYDGIRKAGMDGGMIIGPGCEVPRDAPDANVVAMGEAGVDFWQKNR